MKKIAIALMLLVAITATAQKGNHHNRSHMKDLNPEQIATLQSKKATLALDLTGTQQKQMKVLLLENAELHETRMEAHKDQKESGELKEQTTEERYTRTNERLDHQIAQKAKLKTILSEDQLAKWEKMQHRIGRHHMKNRKGHRSRPTRK